MPHAIDRRTPRSRLLQTPPAIGAPEGVRSLRYRELQALARRTVETLNAAGHRPRTTGWPSCSPTGRRWPASFVVRRRRRSHRAAEPRLPGGRARVLPRRPQGEGAGARGGRGRSAARAVATKMSIPVLELTRGPGAGRRVVHSPPRVRLRDAIARRDGGEGRSPRSSSTPRGRPRARSSSRCSSETSWPAPSTSARTLALTRDDVCLNIMPLFHIHGLIAATLSSLAAGAQRCSARRASTRSSSSPGSMRCEPTWYTAVPTMHQAILARAERNQGDPRPEPPAPHPLLVGVAARAR